MDINEVFSEKSIGIPVKVRMGRDIDNNLVTYYGRYYGRGYDGESTIEDNDYHLLALVTPGGAFVRTVSIHADCVGQDELKALEYWENKEETPYKLFLSKGKNGNYYKNYLYKNTPITFNHNTDEWFEKNGYFEIDARMFGEALAYIATKKLGVEYIYQENRACYEFPEFYGCKRYNKYIKNISFISPMEYGEYYKHWISKYPFINREGYFAATPFDKNPIKIKENEIALFSGEKWHANKQTYLSNINLGELDKGEFKPNNFKFIDGVQHNNDKYGFVQDFIIEIMNYKLQNRKPELTQEDIIIIIKKFDDVLSVSDEYSKTLKLNYSRSVLNR